jgi:hypothetical protein
MFTKNLRFFGQIASAMGCPNSKNRPKKGLRPSGVKIQTAVEVIKMVYEQSIVYVLVDQKNCK